MPSWRDERAADNIPPTERLPWRLEHARSRRARSEAHRPRRALLWFISVILAGAIGLMISQMYWLISTPIGVSVRQERETAEAVYVFYDAVSAALQTGDGRLIADATTATFINHAVLPGATPDRDGLVRYLAGWHDIGQEALIVVEEIRVVGERAMVHLTVNRTVPVTTYGLTVNDPPALWSTTDVLRIEGHRVAERWSGDGHEAGFQSLGSGAINLAGSERVVVTLERVVLNEGILIQVPATVRAILIESGSIQTRHFTDRRPDLPIYQVVTMDASDGVITIAELTSLTNARPGAATFLAIRITGSDSLVGEEGRSNLPGPIASPWGSSVVVQTLAGAVPMPSLKDVTALAFGRVILSVGEAFSASLHSGVLLALCESGSFAIDLTGGQAWVHKVSDGSSQEYTDGRVSLTSGDGVQISTGSVMTLRAPRAEPVTVLMVVLSSPTST